MFGTAEFCFSQHIMPDLDPLVQIYGPIGTVKCVDPPKLNRGPY